MANDYIKFSRTEYEVVGGMSKMQNSIMDPGRDIDFALGYLSPVSDAYKKVDFFEERYPSRLVLKRPY